MNVTAETFPQLYKQDLLRAIDAIDLNKVAQAIEILREARDTGRAIFVCGNGGSAATASHFVCDVLKGASFQRERRFRIMALNDSLPTLTAYSNDVGYECVFVGAAEELRAAGRRADRDQRVGQLTQRAGAMEYAAKAGCRTIALSGRDGGKLGPMADLNIQVANPHMGRIEDGHMIVAHMIAYYFMDAERPVV